MSRFTDVFGAGKVVLPVLHVEGTDGALRNAEIVQKSGAPGCWIISHGLLDWKALLLLHLKLRAEFPTLWFGVNFLDLPSWMAVGKVTKVLTPPVVQGLWVDDLGIQEGHIHQPLAENLLKIRGDWPGLLFGGVAFKYQREVPEALQGLAAAQATPYADVVVTSGPGMGKPVPVRKLATMKKALRESGIPLAVASSVTPENVGEILPHIDCILVATGVSRSFTELDPDKLNDLLRRVQDG